jgi:hypothetical protein
MLFGPFGAAIKGLAHETTTAGGEVLAKEVQRRLPKAFASFLAEPAFSMDRVSYCYWREVGETSWCKIDHPDKLLLQSDAGSGEHLSLLVGPAHLYQKFAAWYYETTMQIEAIEAVCAYEPLTDSLTQALNRKIGLADVREDAAEIGNPVGH